MKNKLKYERDRKRAQRAKIYADKSLHAAFLAKERRYWKDRVARGATKRICQLSPGDQLKQREKWRIFSRNYRKRVTNSKNSLQFFKNPTVRRRRYTDSNKALVQNIPKSEIHFSVGQLVWAFEEQLWLPGKF